MTQPLSPDAWTCPKCGLHGTESILDSHVCADDMPDEDAFAAQAVAAERAKPAASDREAAKALRRELELLGIDMHRNIADSRVPDILAAALAERGERERERAAKIAEEYWRDGRSGFGVAATIRNQTGD